MKSAALILVSLLVLSSVNAQGATAPTFIKDQTAAQNWVTCMGAIAANPCASAAAGNQAACATAQANYGTCSTGCLSKSSYSDFKSCADACGTTATGASSDLSTYVSSMNACNAKLSSSLLSLSALLLFVLALVF